MQPPSRLFAFLLVFVFFCCKEKNTGMVEVTGEVKNIEALISASPGMFPGDSIKIALYEVPFGGEVQPIELDSTYVSKTNGKFTLKGQSTKEGLYDVVIDKGPMIPLINDGVVDLTIDLTNKTNYYTVSGSSASKKLHDFIFGYSEKSTITSNAFKILDSLKMTSSSDSAIIAATDDKNKNLSDLNQFLKSSLEKTDHPLVAAFSLGMASRSFSRGEYDSSLNSLIAKYPTDPNLQYLKNQLKNSETQSSPEETASWVGKPAPEMSMPDVDGKEVSLASFKGKFVLVDFWASWCGPCRMENPNVLRAYNTFKSRNFTVLGVSLDKEKDNWLEAIKKDSLSWTHISDLAFWNSKSVEIFKFQGIPYNILIDPQGIIIDEGLRGSDLMNKLQEVLK